MKSQAQQLKKLDINTDNWQNLTDNGREIIYCACVNVQQNKGSQIAPVIKKLITPPVY